MLFSSNQILEISGSLSFDEELKAALEFALMYSGNEGKIGQADDGGCELVYQITEDGKYCIGWTCRDGAPEGWTEYPSTYGIADICKDIKQYLEGFPVEYGNFDGMYGGGFVMKCVKEWLGSEYDGIKNPYYGIVYFQPFTCYYSK